MNVITGLIFSVLMVIGWIMVLWFAVIAMLGRDIRRQIRMMGAVPPDVKWKDVWFTLVYNLVTVLLTVGYFFDSVQSIYEQNQLALLAVATIVVGMATVADDKLHHVLMEHIACLDAEKGKTGKDENNKGTAETVTNKDME